MTEGGGPTVVTGAGWRSTMVRHRAALTLIAAVMLLAILVYFVADRVFRFDLGLVPYLLIVVQCAIGTLWFLMAVPGLATAVQLALIYQATVHNPWLVVLAGGTGLALATIATYYSAAAARRLVEPPPGKPPGRVRRWVLAIMRWSDAAVAVRPFVTIMVLAAAPLPVDAAGLSGGNARVPLARFYLAAWLGKLVRAGVLVAIGYFGLAQMLPA